MAAQAREAFSTKSHEAAPRLRPWIPRRPLPAKSCSVRGRSAPIEARAEKMAPRTRSEVGRVAREGGPARRGPLALPAITRIAAYGPTVAESKEAGSSNGPSLSALSTAVTASQKVAGQGG